MDDAADPPPHSRFSAADLDEITRGTFVRRVEFHQAIASTNDRALQIARTIPGELPMLVLAESQTDGRGRGTNLWWARPGALTFSLLLPADHDQLPPNRWPQVSLTTGLAICEAIEELLSEPEIRPRGLPEDEFQATRIQLKWPNDVYVRGRKVCGVLIEVPPKQKQTLVIGIGINVNNSAQHAPEQLRRSAIALCEAAGKQLSLTAVLVCVLGRLQDRLQSIGKRDAELRKRWRERCLLSGRDVQLDTPTGRVVGLCRGIDEDGALVIETADKTERCYAGAITQF